MSIVIFIEDPIFHDNLSFRFEQDMTTLKVIKSRIKSVTNTKKITQSMKMVSASKYARAEEDLRNARPMNESTKYFYQEIGTVPSLEIDSQLLVALTSDNGLCGAIHSGIARAIHDKIADRYPSLASKNTKLMCIGEYSMSILSRRFAGNLIWTANGIRKRTITFLDAAVIAMKINECITEHNFAIAKVFFNQLLSGMSYKPNVVDLYHKDVVHARNSSSIYDDIEVEILESYIEFSYIVLIYWMMKEGACSELAARIVAMENATKNAGKVSEALTQQLNRTRQAVITNELIDIISGANALK